MLRTNKESRTSRTACRKDMVAMSLAPHPPTSSNHSLIPIIPIMLHARITTPLRGSLEYTCEVLVFEQLSAAPGPPKPAAKFGHINHHWHQFQTSNGQNPTNFCGKHKAHATNELAVRLKFQNLKILRKPQSSEFTIYTLLFAPIPSTRTTASQQLPLLVLWSSGMILA